MNQKNLLQNLDRAPVSILSPLRYPGSKRRLAHYLQKIIEDNHLFPEFFVEPFAGGASVSLQLLNDGVVKNIILNDLDPMVSDFWNAVFFDTEWLIESINNIEINLETWNKIKNSSLKSNRDRAFACIFLNRTSYSGIIAERAGPIGGQKQKSKFPLNCRFPKDTLIKRIRQIELLKDNVLCVSNLSWIDCLTNLKKKLPKKTKPEDRLVYLDPPFFEKADRLYNYYFSDKQHIELRDFLMQCEYPWILSYDSHKKVDELYSNTPSRIGNVELIYSTSSNIGIRCAMEVVVTNLSSIPTDTRTWTKTSKISSLSTEAEECQAV